MPVLSSSSSDAVVVNGAGPVGLTFAIALLDRATQLGSPKPNVQIWDPSLQPAREVVIRVPWILAARLPEQIQMELWNETPAMPQRLFVPGQCMPSCAVENSRVHDPYSQPPSRYTAIVQVKQFQEAMMRYLRERHPHHCTFNQGKCPPEVMQGAAVVVQSYGKAARKTNPIVGNAVSEEAPIVSTEVPCEHGLFVLFDRTDVTDGERAANYLEFNERGNGFAAFQSHSLANAVQTYIFPEDATNNTGNPLVPTTPEQLINDGRSFGLKALFDCVPLLQGQEDWWWEVSRRCRLQGDNGEPVARELACTLECRKGFPGWLPDYPQSGEKASSPAFEAWFDAVRYQIALNMHRMGIFGSNAENFLHKVRFCYARRQPYRYNSVYTEVQGVPVIYLGDSAGSTDFKKGLSCGRGLLCASQLAFDALDVVSEQWKLARAVDLKRAFQLGGDRYQQQWSSPDLVAEWHVNFDASYKYLQAGRSPAVNFVQDLHTFALRPGFFGRLETCLALPVH